MDEEGMGKMRLRDPLEEPLGGGGAGMAPAEEEGARMKREKPRAEPQREGRFLKRAKTMRVYYSGLENRFFAFGVWFTFRGLKFLFDSVFFFFSSVTSFSVSFSRRVPCPPKSRNRSRTR